MSTNPGPPANCADFPCIGFIFLNWTLCLLIVHLIIPIFQTPKVKESLPKPDKIDQKNAATENTGGTSTNIFVGKLNHKSIFDVSAVVAVSADGKVQSFSEMMGEALKFHKTGTVFYIRHRSSLP